MIEDHTREQLEDVVIEKAKVFFARYTRHEPAPDWGTSQEFREYIAAFRQLAAYYRTHPDVVIGVEVLKEYMFFLTAFTEMRMEHRDEDLWYNEREGIENALHQLQGCMFELLKYAVRNVYKPQPPYISSAALFSTN